MVKCLFLFSLCIWKCTVCKFVVPYTNYLSFTYMYYYIIYFITLNASTISFERSQTIHIFAMRPGLHWVFWHTYFSCPNYYTPLTNHRRNRSGMCMINNMHLSWNPNRPSCPVPPVLLLDGCRLPAGLLPLRPLRTPVYKHLHHHTNSMNIILGCFSSHTLLNVICK